jgi:hypothetical protein
MAAEGGQDPALPVEVAAFFSQEWIDTLTEREDVLRHVELLSSVERVVKVALQHTVDAARDLNVPWSVIGESADCTTANAHKRWGQVRYTDRPNIK